MNYYLNFRTSYHQFYLMDKGSIQDTGDDNFWTEEATNDRLAIGEGALGIGLECYGPVKGEIVLLSNKKNGIDFSQYDHVVEGGIYVESGILQVLDCPNSNVELEINVNPGLYRVRVYSSNLESVIDGESGDDYYKIEVWPDTDTKRTVLKQYLVA